MTQYEELKAEISALKAENTTLKAKIEKLETPMIYNFIDENMPEWARESVKWCVDNGAIVGTGDGLGLDDKDLKWCTIVSRLLHAMKLYD